MTRTLIAIALVACGRGTPTTPIPSTIALPAGFHPYAIAAADLDGDGAVDLAVCDDGGRLLVLAGPSFATVVDRDACGAHPEHLIAAEVDGDGAPDLVAANHDTDYVTVVYNRHEKLEPVHVQVHSRPHPHAIAAADVDGDGRVDLVTDSWGENRLVLVRGGLDGSSRGSGEPIDIGRKPAYVNVVAADLDGDGNVERAVPSPDAGEVPIADGRRPFAAPPPIDAAPAPFMLAFGDVDNGDGRIDLDRRELRRPPVDRHRPRRHDPTTWIRNDGNDGGRRNCCASRARGRGR